MNIEDLSLMS